jgi:ABC-2 type transport system permease protein
MKTYLAFTRGTFMVGLVYRFGFLFAVIGNALYMGVAYYLWRSIYHNTTTLHGLTFDETFLYVGLGSGVFILLKTYADWIIHYEIREGAIASYLIKPIDFQIYALFASFGSVLLNGLATTVPTLLILIFIFKIKIVFGLGLVFFPISLLLAFLVSFSIDYFIGVTGFYTESVWGIVTTKEILLSILSGALIPLQFFPIIFQKILFALPFQAIFYTPLMMVTKPNQDVKTLLTSLGIQLFWAVTLFIATRLFYNQAIKVLRIGGG